MSVSIFFQSSHEYIHHRSYVLSSDIFHLQKITDIFCWFANSASVALGMTRLIKDNDCRLWDLLGFCRKTWKINKGLLDELYFSKIVDSNWAARLSGVIALKRTIEERDKCMVKSEKSGATICMISFKKRVRNGHVWMLTKKLHTTSRVIDNMNAGEPQIARVRNQGVI